MPPQEVRRLVLRQPFQPLRIFVSDGATFDLLDPSHIYVSRLGIEVGIDPDESGVPRNTEYIAPNHITRMEPLDPSAPLEAGSRT